jgi:hypothetical protein
MLKFFYVMASLYFTQLTLLKLTLIFFYIRVFPSKPVQRLLWGTVIFVTLWGLTFVCLAIFQCQPISYFWTHWDGLHEGHCLDINAITASNAGISIALDLWILGIPLWQLWGLKMHWKKKVGVAVMFCVGTFVTVVSILRLSALVHFAQSSNASWEFYDVSVWSTIEICVGIMWYVLSFTLIKTFTDILKVLVYPHSVCSSSKSSPSSAAQPPAADNNTTTTAAATNSRKWAPAQTPASQRAAHRRADCQVSLAHQCRHTSRSTMALRSRHRIPWSVLTAIRTRPV